MDGSDTCVADPVDTVHHEMDSTVLNLRLTMFINLCGHTSDERKTCPREGACWPIHTMNLQYIHGSKST